MKDDIKMKYGIKKVFVVKQHATFIYYIFALIAKTAQLMHEKKFQKLTHNETDISLKKKYM